MYPGATVLTRMPRGPSSVAREWPSATRAVLAILYPAYRSREWWMTAEAIITTELGLPSPAPASSSGVNSWVARSAPRTDRSIPRAIWSWSVSASGRMLGTENAL